MLHAEADSNYSRNFNNGLYHMHHTLALIPRRDETTSTVTQSRDSAALRADYATGDDARKASGETESSQTAKQADSLTEFPWPAPAWSRSQASGISTETERETRLSPGNLTPEPTLPSSNGDSELSGVTSEAKAVGRKQQAVSLPPIRSGVEAAQGTNVKQEKLFSEEEQLSLPPLTSGIYNKHLTDHDADDERESTLDLTNRRTRHRSLQRSSAAATATSKYKQ